MTCIVGVQTNEGAWLGADSLATDENSNRTRKLLEPKIETIGPITFGGTGTMTMIQTLRYCWTPSEQPRGMDDVTFLRTSVLPSMKKAITDIVLSSGTEDEGCVLLVYRGKLYEAWIKLLLAMAPSLGYAAAGSGCQYALGSLYATTSIADPRQRIIAALNAATEFDPGVSDPFNLVRQPLGKESEKMETVQKSYLEKIDVQRLADRNIRIIR